MSVESCLQTSLRIFPEGYKQRLAPRFALLYPSSNTWGEARNFSKSQSLYGGARSNISTYFFILLHIFDILFLYIFHIFLHIFLYFPHISCKQKRKKKSFIRLYGGRYRYLRISEFFKSQEYEEI